MRTGLIVGAVVVLALVVFYFGTDFSVREQPGPTEQVGQTMDNAGEEVGEGIEEAGDAVGDTAEGAGDALQEGARETGEAIGEGTREATGN